MARRVMMSHGILIDAADTGAIAFAGLVTMWTVMMTAMMAPVAWPWVVAFRGILAPASNGVPTHSITTLSFAGGYLSAWLLYGAAAAALQIALQRAGLVDPHHGLAHSAGAVILIVAGIFQLTPLKRACLTHCRSPLSFLLARWQNGPPSAYRIGVSHGIYCVGCCWALMATMLAVGVTNLVWMAVLTAAVFIEQVVPGGGRIRVPMGLALIVGGAGVALQ